MLMTFFPLINNWEFAKIPDYVWKGNLDFYKKKEKKFLDQYIKIYISTAKMLFHKIANVKINHTRTQRVKLGIRSTYICPNSKSCQLRIHVRYNRALESFYFTVFGDCKCPKTSTEQFLAKLINAFKKEKSLLKLLNTNEAKFQKIFNFAKETKQQLEIPKNKEGNSEDFSYKISQ